MVANGSGTIATPTQSDMSHVKSSSAENQPLATGELASEPAPVPTQPTETRAKVTYGCIDFRQHETIMCTPQGGFSTVPKPSLGRVTEYVDHDRLDVDAYEELRAPYRKKIVDAPKSTIRGRKKRLSLQAMRSKAMKDQAEATDEDGDKEQEQNATTTTSGASPAMNTSLTIEAFFKRSSSSLARARQRIAEQISSLSFLGRQRENADSTVL